MTQQEKQAQIKSLRERLIMHKEFFPVYSDAWVPTYSPYNGLDKWDIKWDEPIYNPLLSDFQTVICETKVRNYPLSAYTGWIIEKDKYDYLMSQPQDKKLYINIHPDGFQIWDLEELVEPNWFNKEERSNNFNQDTRNKIEGDLSSLDATIIKKEININEYLNKANIIFNKRNK